MKNILAVSFFMLFCTSVYAQKTRIDSLLTKTDRIEDIKNLQLVADELIATPQGAFALLKKGKQDLAKAEKTGLVKKQQIALLLIGDAAFQLHDAPELLTTSLKGIRICHDTNDNTFLPYFLHQAGLANIYDRNYHKSINYFSMATNAAMTAHNIGRALDSYSDAESCYVNLDMPDSALFIARRELSLLKQLTGPEQSDYRSEAMGDLAEALAAKGNIDSALYYDRTVYEYEKKRSPLRSQFPYIETVFANMYLRSGKPDSAAKYALDAYDRASKTKTWEFTASAASILAKAYGGSDDKKSLFYLKAQITANDSINASDKARQFELIADKDRQHNDELKAEQEKYNTRIRFYFVIAVAVALLIIGFILWRNNRKQKYINRQLGEQKEEISAQRDQLENKNMELEIEAALERVRTAAMGMRTRDDLLNICQILFEELTALGFGELRNALINIVNDENGSFLNYDFNGGNGSSVTHFLYNSHPVMERQVAMTRSASDAFFEHVLTGAELEDFKAFREQNGEPPDPKLENISTLYYYFYSIGVGSVGVSAFSSLGEEKREVLKRFRNVFDLAYRRYADIELAAGQAREAQIELALERVRARTMAMYHSEELAETAAVLFEQLSELGNEPARISIGILDQEKDVVNFWATDQEGDQINISFKARISEQTTISKMYEGRKEKIKSLSIDLEGEELAEWVRFCREEMGIIIRDDLLKKRRVHTVGYFSQGWINYTTHDPLSAETIKVLERFSAVFDHTYTRFLDLQKAEAQAREAQIELALERVRARTMAMHTSEHVGETVATMFDELVKLGIEKTARCGIAIIGDNQEMELWRSSYNPDGGVDTVIGRIDMTIHPHLEGVYQAWKNKETVYFCELTGKNQEDYFRALNNSPAYPAQFDLASLPAKQTNNVFYFPEGCVYAFTIEPLSENAVKLFKRFAGVFGLTYRRYLDLQKAEEQARESQIQLALERVRARTMAMQKSEELQEVIQLVYEQLNQLNFNIDVANFALNYKETDDLDLWLAAKGRQYATQIHVPYFDHPMFTRFNKAKEQGGLFTDTFSLEEKNLFFEHFFKHTPGTSEERKVVVFDKPGFARSVAFMKNTALTISNYEGNPYSEAENNILLRFGKVFDQTYTRFNDLKQAEEQAKESQIQLALERVRARTMAMQKSEELAETATVLFQQLLSLGINSERTFIATPNDDTRKFELWGTEQGGNQMSTRFEYEADATYAFREIYKAWQEKRSELTVILKGKNLEEHVNYVRNVLHMPLSVALVQKQRILYNAFFSKGLLMIVTPDAQSKETLDILERFAGVFDGTYTRFLDLQKAEEQTREATIEAALERVRAAAMAMHDSNDVGNATALVFSELYKLGINTIRCGVVIIEESTQLMEVWSATSPKEGKIDQGSGKLDMTTHPLWQSLFNTWKQKKPVLTYELAGQDLWDYYKAISSAPGYHAPELDPDYAIPDDISKARQFCNCFIFAEGGLFAFTLEPFSPKESQILEKFAAVFSLTYRRYLDLKQAEEQAREAHIEASLERVRGKAMAMRNTNDLSVTASTVFTELRNLGINPIRSGVGLVNKKTRKAKIYSSTSSSTAADLSLMGEVALSGHPVFEQQYKSWLKQENYAVALKGADLASYNKILSAGLNADLETTGKDQTEQYGHWFMFSEGFLYAWSGKSYTEAEIKILERFKNVIELTFRRYIELQKSEASARDAVREASLDRVRAETASMRSTEDLERITPLIWNELTILDIPFIRCGVFIIDEQERLIHTHLSTADGKALATFNLQFDSEGIGRTVLHAWHEKQIATIHWSREEFANYTQSLVDQGTVKSKERYVTEHPDTRLDLHFFPFLQGMLYVGNIAQLTIDEMDLVQSLADAFSTAYARYEDFNKLEAAKQQVENTLTDLKAAQTKLIQSEKMASLGELTAGIAHEIQNPLNFVNNFSEVNQEMIDELQEELRAGNIEEALVLAADIKQNEEKINHHGKRADGIVKGMLQHSRTGGGEKQPINMNTLADEFLRLSYHGLRAKDKLFNSEMVTHFDPDLPKINVIPQDVGRVLLNLFNNAFYAVNQKQKNTGANYKPEVSVSTSTENNYVVIKVKDNGNGIPDAIKEKIMQPFFTTKPTGDGTGLGLSLSYDMVVKGHGGSIMVNSVEGEGSEFIISLPII